MNFEQFPASREKSLWSNAELTQSQLKKQVTGNPMSKTPEFIMRVLKLKDVLSKTGLGKTSLYKLINLSEFPKPISLGLRSVGWLESEIEAWIQDKINARDRRAV